MSAIYIKVHLRELDEERIVTLSPTAFRTLMFLRLLAGIEDHDGELPSLSQIAFRLRANAGPLEADLEELRRAGLINQETSPWRLTTFQDEQAPVSGAERTRAWRERYGVASSDETSQESPVLQEQEEDESRQEEGKSKVRQGKVNRHENVTFRHTPIAPQEVGKKRIPARKRIPDKPKRAPKAIRKEKGSKPPVARPECKPKLTGLTSHKKPPVETPKDSLEGRLSASGNERFHHGQWEAIDGAA